MLIRCFPDETGPEHNPDLRTKNMLQWPQPGHDWHRFIAEEDGQIHLGEVAKHEYPDIGLAVVYGGGGGNQSKAGQWDDLRRRGN